MTLITLSNRNAPQAVRTYRLSDPVFGGATVWLSLRDTELWVVEPPQRARVRMDELKGTLVTARRVFARLCKGGSALDSRQSRVSRTCLAMITDVVQAADEVLLLEGSHGAPEFCPCLLLLLDTLVWDLLRLRCAEDGMQTVRLDSKAEPAAALFCSSDMQVLRHVRDPWVSVSQALDSLAVRCFTVLMVLRHMRERRKRSRRFLHAGWALAGFLLALTLEERRCADPWANPVAPSLRISLAECSSACNVCECLSEMENAADEAQAVLRMLKRT